MSWTVTLPDGRVVTVESRVAYAFAVIGMSPSGRGWNVVATSRTRRGADKAASLWRHYGWQDVRVVAL